MSKSLLQKFSIVAFQISFAIFLTGINDVSAQQETPDGEPNKQNQRLSIGDWFQLLANDSVRADMDISPDQLDEIQALELKHRKEIQELHQSLRDIPREVDIEFRREQTKEVQSTIVNLSHGLIEEFEDILKPKQLERLKQIRLRLRLSQHRKTGAMTGLLNPEIVEALEISELQQIKIQRKAAELNKELQRKIEKLREEVEQELLGELTEDQRKDYQNIVGKPFEK